MLRQASRARLFKEYKEVQREKSADPDIQLVCDDSNIFKWTALIKVCSLIDYDQPLFSWLISSTKPPHPPPQKKGEGGTKAFY